MKRIICLLLTLILLTGLLTAAVRGAETFTSLGWRSDSSDFSGWSVSGDTITGDFNAMVNKRIWLDCLTDMRNFVVEMDISSDNISSPYIQILGVVTELDANHGNGDQVYVKVAGEGRDWMDAKGTETHVRIARSIGGDLQITLSGAGYDNTQTFTAVPVRASTNVEIGMYRGGKVTIRNLTVRMTGDGSDTGPAVDYNTLVIPVTAGEHFEFKGTGNWREPTHWTSGVSKAEGIWLQSDSADGAGAEAMYMTEKLSENWEVALTFRPISTMNDGRTVCRTVFTDASRTPVMLLTLEHLASDGKVKFSWQTANGNDWTEVWKDADWVLAKDSAFTVRMRKVSDSAIELSVTGDRGYRQSVTKTVSSAILASISRAGVGTERSTVRITNFTLTAETKNRDYTALAQQTYQNLMKNYLDRANNRLYPVRWGFRDGDVTNTGRSVTVSGVGEVWESTVMMMALDTYAQTLEKDSAAWTEVARIIANTVNMLNSGYTEKQMTTAASAPNYAMDDTGWNVMGLLLGYYYNRELGNKTEADRCLRYARGLFNSGYETFYSQTLGGLCYTTKQEDVSLYGAAMALAGFYLNQIAPDEQIEKRYTDIYNGLENLLRRPDGLYWCGVTATGAQGRDRPYGIGEAGSVTYLGGNMAMAVLNALLGETEKAEQTVLGIVRYESDNGGAFLNDRDAWNNTFFLGMFVREVIPKGIAGDIAQRALDATVTRVLENACFADGYYSASWLGPREPSSVGYPSEGDYSTDGRNNWGKGYNNNGLNVGSTPNQIMTSASTAHVLLAAALSASYEKAPQPPDDRPDEPTTPADPSLPTNPTPPTDPAPSENPDKPGQTESTPPEPTNGTENSETAGNVPSHSGESGGKEPAADEKGPSLRWLWISAAVIAAAGAAAAYLFRKKKKK